MRKKISVLAAACMIVSSLNYQPVFAATNQEQLNTVKEPRMIQKLKENAATDSTAEKLGLENVTLLVELEAPSLLEHFSNFNGPRVMQFADLNETNAESFSAFEASNQGQAIKKSIQEEQDAVIELIEKQVNDGEKLEVLRTYDGIANMIVINSKMDDIQKIENLEQVKNVSISITYDRPDGKVADTSIGTGRDLIYGNEIKYKGEGMLVAVLDTGLDTKHEAFNSGVTGGKYSKADIANLLEKKEFVSETYAENAATSVDSVYQNEKVIYAYDYCDEDCKVDPTVETSEAGNDHGHHVAGIIAAKSDTMTGMVPEAQLAIMKVFPDVSGGAPDTVIFDALEDCLSLDVDVINMSLGSSCGYTHDDTDIREEIYSRIQASGINLVVAAANDGRSCADNIYGGYALGSNPDIGTVGSPSTNPAALSVASLENTLHYALAITLSDGTVMGGADSATSTEPTFVSLFADGVEKEYVVVGGFGEEKDYETVDVTGKIAVVKRGEITFEDKHNYAAEKGAIGLVVYNREKGALVNMSITDRKIPSVFISMEDGEKMLNAEVQTIVKAGEDFVDNPTAFEMSSFSSWGCTPDLKLKPELTGVGGFVYSTLPFNAYGNMQGTSMACPQIAGAATAVKQYLRESGTFGSLSNYEMEQLVNNLLMSTAQIIPTEGYAINPETEDFDEDPITLPYSPRVQGAGLANVEAATKTQAYLYNDENENGRPVINYGDSEEGVFSQTFHIVNSSSEPVKYALKSTVLADDYLYDGEDFYIAGSPLKLTAGTEFSVMDESVCSVSGSAIKVEDDKQVYAVSGSSIVVAPKTDVEIELTVSLTELDKEYLDILFSNGDFVEGFLELEVLDGPSTNLNIPFLGFYGDWTAAPIFEANIYDVSEGTYTELPSNFTSISNLAKLSGIVVIDGEIYYATLGNNLYSYSSYAYRDRIAISPNGDDTYDTFMWRYSPLRGPKNTHYTITTEDGTVVYTKNESGDRKAIYDSKYAEFDEYYCMIDWDGTDAEGNALPNNTKVYFNISAELDYDAHEQNNKRCTETFPIVIDTEAPVIKDIKVNSEAHTVDITVVDNQNICGVDLTNYSTGVYETQVVKNPQPNTEVTLTFEYDSEEDNYVIEVGDYAFNITQEMINLNDYISKPNPVTPEPTVTPDPTVTPEPTVTPVPGFIGDKETEDSYVVSYDANTSSEISANGESLGEHLAKGQDVTYEFVDNGKVLYSWKFDAEDYKDDVKLEDIDLGVTTKSGKESSYKNGVEVQFEQEGVLPIEAKVTVYVGDSFKPNQKVYLYRVDPETGMLICVPNSTYRVNADGTIDLNVIQGDEYVILSKAAKSKEKVAVIDQVEVPEKISCEKGSKTTIQIELPATLTQVASMKDFDSNVSQSTYGAVITYKSSNTKVATVSKTGVITTKKAGKATITVTVKLSNGKTKNYKTEVTVK